MAHEGMDLAETRRAERAAFRAVADVLQANRHRWEYHGNWRFSFERFCSAVDHLCGIGSPTTGPSARQVPGRWENLKADALMRMVERMNLLVDFVEDPRSGVADAAHLLPARSTLPLDDEGIVAFCRAVYSSLRPLPGATTIRGGFASRMRNLNASLSLYAHYEDHKGQQVQRPTIIEDEQYVSRREICLHLLLVQVDGQMHKLARYVAFQDAYHEARAVLMKLTVQAREDFFRK